MIELFHRQQCPYSKRVRDFIEQNGLKDQINYLEIGEDENAFNRLQSLNGRTQVPCLVVDGEPRLESEEIITWLSENAMPH